MPKATRDTELRVRVTPAERKALQAAADARGLTLSAWLRMVALDTAKAAIATQSPVASPEGVSQKSKKGR